MGGVLRRCPMGVSYGGFLWGYAKEVSYGGCPTEVFYGGVLRGCAIWGCYIGVSYRGCPTGCSLPYNLNSKQCGRFYPLKIPSKYVWVTSAFYAATLDPVANN